MDCHIGSRAYVFFSISTGNGFYFTAVREHSLLWTSTVVDYELEKLTFYFSRRVHVYIEIYFYDEKIINVNEYE